MKVLFDAHPAIQKKTGVGRYADNLIKNLPKIDKNLNLSLYTHPPYPKEYNKFTSFASPVKNGIFRTFLGLPIAVNKLKPDILHINNFAPIIKTCPIVMTVHDVCFKTLPERYPIKTLLAFKLFFQMSLDKADVVVCVSKTTKKLLLRYFRVDKKKIHVVYEASDPQFKIVGKSTARKKVNKSFGLNKPYFLVVGNIEPRKNPSLITDAFKKFSNKTKGFDLVLVGPNISKKKSGKNVKILGYVTDEDLNYLYNASQGVIYFSECEGFGLPVLEAMAAGTPVICKEINVFKELFDGACIFAKNKDELAKSMEKLSSDKLLRQKYTRLGLKKVRQFSWERAAKETAKLYRKAIIST